MLKLLCSVAFLTLNISLSAVSFLICDHLLFRSSSFHLCVSGHFNNRWGLFSRARKWHMPHDTETYLQMIPFHLQNNILWRKDNITILILGWIPGRSWKNKSKCYTYLTTYIIVKILQYVHTLQMGPRSTYNNLAGCEFSTHALGFQIIVVTIYTTYVNTKIQNLAHKIVFVLYIHNSENRRDYNIIIVPIVWRLQ